MIKIKLSSLLLIAILEIAPNCIFAQQTDNTSESRMRRDVTLLASDSLSGREAGTRGEQMASEYISRQMAEIGLLPKGNEGGSYLSEFRMSFPVIFKEAKLRIDNVDFKHTEEFGATDLSSEGSVTASLINVGRGESFSHNHSDKGKFAVQGKIVLMDISSKKKYEDNAKLLEDISKRVSSLVKQGAVAIVLHNSSRKAIEDVLFGSPFTESLPVPVVYIARLPFNKIDKVKNATCSMTVQIDRTISKPVNVIGWIDNKSAKTVVVGAHYDHVGITKPRTGVDKTLQIHNGADDNASGTAAMLEIARWAVNNETLKYNYIFAAFSAEEKGLFGSKAFCSRRWVTNDSIIYMLNLDMVGRLGCQGDTISALGIASSEVWEKLVDNLDHPDFAIKKISGAPAFSDHSPFLKKGIPVMYFTTGLHPDYHNPQDDTERINFEGMVEIVTFIRAFMRSAEALPDIPFCKINTLQNTRAYIQTF
jgi:hypothetical protein